MVWCEGNSVDYVFGLVGNAVLHRLGEDVTETLEVIPRR